MYDWEEIHLGGNRFSFSFYFLLYPLIFILFLFGKAFTLNCGLLW